MPTVRTYTFDDLTTAMNSVASYDWKTFFRNRLDATDAHAPLGGISAAGWQVSYNDEPNAMITAAQAAAGIADYTSSIGMVIKSDGTVQDAIPGMPAYESGISPYSRVMGVNRAQFSIDELNNALVKASKEGGHFELLVANAGRLETQQVNYHDGLRYPHLERNQETNYLDEILRSRSVN